MITIPNARLRRWLQILIPFVCVPALVAVGATVLPEKQYLLVSFGVALLAVLLFITGFEQKRVGARRLVLVAVMTALCIVGRFIPFFKPITALSVIAALYLGPESGFFVGSVAALLSNFYFGQGPWTPFQMLAWGLIGLLAGYLAGPLKRRRWLLLAYGVAAGVAFSFLMDVWTVLWYAGRFEWQYYLSALAAAVPHTVLYAVSNFVFLWFLAKPMGEKLERIKVKYGV